MMTAATAEGTAVGSGSGGGPLLNRMSVCTSFSPSQGALPESR